MFLNTQKLEIDTLLIWYKTQPGACKNFGVWGIFGNWQFFISLISTWMVWFVLSWIRCCWMVWWFDCQVFGHWLHQLLPLCGSRVDFVLWWNGRGPMMMIEHLYRLVMTIYSVYVQWVVIGDYSDESNVWVESTIWILMLRRQEKLCWKRSEGLNRRTVSSVHDISMEVDRCRVSSHGIQRPVDLWLESFTFRIWQLLGFVRLEMCRNILIL